MVARVVNETDPSEASHSRRSTRRAEARTDPSLEVVFDEPRAPEPAEVPVIARLGRYEILGRMAVGGMAEIYLARARSSVGISRHVVVKVVRSELEGDADFETMFLQEGRLALGLKHPNICHVYEVGRSRGRCFIAMEHVQGVTLNDLVRRANKSGARVPTSIVVKIAAQVAEALHSAHTAKDAAGRALGVVHRDVTPHNVMIGYDGSVKLLDFGVAQARTHVADEGSGTIKGKLGYLAPEQCVGGPMDARSDVFALGICLWEGLTGRRLFKRATELETLTAIVRGEVPAPSEHEPEVCADLDAIVRCALAKSPDERWQSAEELGEALEGFLSEARDLVNAARIARFVASLYPDAAAPELDARPSIVAWLGPMARSGRAPPRRARWPLAALAVGLGLSVLALASTLWPEAPLQEAARSDAARSSVPAAALEEGPAGLVEASTQAARVDEARLDASGEVREPALPEVSEHRVTLDPGASRRRARRRAGEAWRHQAPGGFVADPGF